METTELLAIIANGEDYRHQFKADIKNANALASEMVAFSNSSGGYILIGISDNGEVFGLNDEDIRRINQTISNAAADFVKPAINPVTQNFSFAEGKVLLLTVEEGLNKPYMDNNGYIWVKSGSDKRRVTAREEMQRIFQAANLIHADETPVHGSSVDDLDVEFFDAFFEREYGERVEELGISRAELLENMNLAHNGRLNICGTLLFASKPHVRLPIFVVKGVAFPGVDIEDETYLDSQDMTGKLSDVYRDTLSFVLRNIRHVQNEQGFNSLGEPEIPRIALEELIANALIHRDYFVSAPVKVLIFEDRVEIVSPGHLPNNLTIENIKMGNSNVRNPILASFATKILPYRGIGSGIRRALKAYPHIDLIDDRSQNQFNVIIHRQAIG